MGDNNKEPIIGEDKKEDKVIFQAVLDKDKNVQVFLFSDFVPIITYAQKLLDMIITGKIVNQQMKAQAKKPIIPVKGGIMNFIRRR